MRQQPITAALAALAVVSTAVHLVWGWPSGDEGWYLYAARELLHGQWPYLDYFFTQGPLTPVVMAPSMAVAGTLWTGRFVSAVCFLAALALGGAWLCRTSAPDANAVEPRVVWLLTFGASSFSVYLCTLALTTVYELLAVTVTLFLLARGRAAWAVAVAALICAVRISLAPWALAVWAFAAWSEPAPRARRAVWLALLGAGIAGLAFLPFALAVPERLWEGLVGYHLAGGRTALSAERAWEFRLYFWRSWALFCWPALAAAAVGYAAAWRTRKWDRIDTLLLSGALALTIVHSLPATPYPKYQIVPTALLALAAARRFGAVRRKAWFGVLATVALVWQVAYYPYAANSVDFVWPSPPARHHQVGRTLAELAPGQPVLTFDTLLAVEGGFRVPAGFEMGPFSFTPSWDDTYARRMGTVTPSMLIDILRTAKFSALALHEDDLGLASAFWRDRAVRALNENYRRAFVVPRIGHFQTPLFVFVRK